MNEIAATPEQAQTVPQINELAEALAKAQGEMEFAKKGSQNPFFKSHYADLASVVQAIKEPLSRNSLAYTQIITSNGTGTYVRTILMHKSGQTLESVMLAKPSKDDMQGLGSAITYARRYALQAICGLSADDDDGENAVGRSAGGKAVVSMPQSKKAPETTVSARRSGITEAQGKALLETASKNGWTKLDLQNYGDTLGYMRLSNMSAEDYEDTLKYFSKNKKADVKKLQKDV